MKEEDLLCFSHLRWNFVFQRPNHLMVRFARERRVFFIEDAMADSPRNWLEQLQIAPNLWRIVPHVDPALSTNAQGAAVRSMLREMCKGKRVQSAIHWFYTPMMLEWSSELPRSLVVYDCMDELRNFMHAPIDLGKREQRLMAAADLVFTGGMALYEAKRMQHSNVHGVPSSVDVAFFNRARCVVEPPPEQADIPQPRVGYCGVIDERIDLDLVDKIAAQRPHYQIVMLGPVTKIDADSLPRRQNIHYLGAKDYNELPRHLACWEVAMMPFALNEATRFISPTKTPEYLAAGRVVVSTPIRDVVEPYGRLGLVRIGHDSEQFISHIDEFMAGARDVPDATRDEFLANTSWDATWERMRTIIEQAREARAPSKPNVRPAVSKARHV